MNDSRLPNGQCRHRFKLVDISMPATSGGIRSWAVAHALTGQPIGPGLVHRTCAELQQQFFDPPLETRSGVGKYR